MYNVHLTHSLLCFEFVEFTLMIYFHINQFLILVILILAYFQCQTRFLHLEWLKQIYLSA